MRAKCLTPPKDVPAAERDERTPETDYRLRILEPALAMLPGGTLPLISLLAFAPFAGALPWAAVLSVTAWRLARRLTDLLGGRRRLASLWIAAACVALLTLPLLYLGTALSALVTDGWRMLPTSARTACLTHLAFCPTFPSPAGASCVPGRRMRAIYPAC